MFYGSVRCRFLLSVCLASICWEAVCNVSAQESAQNSTKKIRVQPGELASRIGTAVQWQKKLSVALEKSRETGKPVFWYVTTVKGSFMDRKKEIDRYMMAGPFSNPQIIRLLNEEFIPVRAKANEREQQTYDLVPFKFIEPGFVVLAPDGSPKLVVDRLTTFQSRWLFQLIASATGKKGLAFQTNPKLTDQWQSAGRGDWDFELPNVDSSDPIAVEVGLLRAMQAFRKGQHKKAMTIFLDTAQLQPDHPLAWKAAAEGEGFGPFVRGFEVVRDLPASVYRAGIGSAGSAAPQGSFDEDYLWRSGVDFLLGMQNEEGGYVDSDYDFGGTDSLPNVHVAVTALAGMALLEAQRMHPQYRSQAVSNALAGCLDYVSEPGNLNRADRDEILWAYAFSTRLIARLASMDQQGGRKKSGEDIATLTTLLQRSVDNLQEVQSKRGGWYHEYENPFVTATALCALYEAQQAGAMIDQDKIRSGVRSLANDRGTLGSFPYSTGRRKNTKRESEQDISAAAGRMPLCELALLLWNESDEARLENAIEQSFKHHDNLNDALKYDDHTSRQAYGGFFFWYDMRARSEAISRVSNPKTRNWLQQRQQKIVMALPEIDGCFVDSHEIGRCYGTAMALLCLARQSPYGDK